MNVLNGGVGQYAMAQINDPAGMLSEEGLVGLQCACNVVLRCKEQVRVEVALKSHLGMNHLACLSE